MLRIITASPDQIAPPFGPGTVVRIGRNRVFGRVINASEKLVFIDLNHELAGKTLVLKIILRRVLPAKN